MLGSIVVKGLLDMFTGTNVAAAKNVDLPTLVFPTIPISGWGGGIVLSPDK